MGKEDPLSSRDFICCIFAFLFPPLGVFLLQSGDPCWDVEGKPWDDFRWHQKYKWTIITFFLTCVGWVPGIVSAVYFIYRFHGTNPNDEPSSDEESPPRKAYDEKKSDPIDEKSGDSNDEKKDTTDKPKKKKKKKHHHRRYTDDTSPEDQKLLEQSRQWELGRSPSDAEVKRKRAAAAKKMRAQYEAALARNEGGFEGQYA